MSLKNAFINELKMEAASTRKMLERVPMDKADWKPHEKSSSLGQLAKHVANTFGWISNVINIDEYDFAVHSRTTEAANSEELLKLFDDTVANALADLEKIGEEELDKNWVVKQGEVVYFTLPKKAGIRGWAFRHLIHHRGQLSVYLRMLDVPVPGMYGPTADEAFG